MKRKVVPRIMLILFLVSMLISTLTIIADSKESTAYASEDMPPVANFTYEPSAPVAGETVTFNASASYDSDGNITIYTWIFGDGGGANETDPITFHVYTQAGRYAVKLIVYDDDGLSNAAERFIGIESAGPPTSLSIFLSSSASYFDFKVEINGNLTSNGIGLSGATIFLSYSIGVGWNDITSVNTASDGSYSVMWKPSATGNYIIRATWSGNATYNGATATVNLAVMPHEGQKVFSVESNSTISGLAFNTTNWELSFTATGPTGTMGYTKVTVAKSLVANITNIRVYLDGNQSEYTITSTDDSWLLTFTYIHSAHQVVVDLDINIVPEFPSITILPLFMFLAFIAVVLAKKKISEEVFSDP